LISGRGKLVKRICCLIAIVFSSRAQTSDPIQDGDTQFPGLVVIALRGIVLKKRLIASKPYGKGSYRTNQPVSINPFCKRLERGVTGSAVLSVIGLFD
jgi:hypothetical protein